MFKCFITEKDSKLGEKPIKVVLEKRPRTYTRRFKDEDGNVSDVIVGRGFENIKEVLMTKEGYDLWVQSNPSGALIINK